MEKLTANEAKSQFGELLLKAQRNPVQISKNGKAVAVVMSAEDFEALEAMKLGYIQYRAQLSEAEIRDGQYMDGDEFMDQLNTEDDE